MTDNFKKVKRVLWIILFANLGVAALKIIIGGMIHSSSMTADGFHSLTDGSSNIVGLVGISFASRPKDEDHNYGHMKYETMAGLFIAGMLFFIGGKIVFDAIARFANPSVPLITIESLIALIFTLVVNICVSTYEFREGKKLDSHILVSDSLHTRSDIYVSTGVLISLLGIKLGLPPIIDPIASLVVAGFIFYACYEIFKNCSDILLDRTPIDNNKIYEIVLNFPQVKNAHKIRSRGCKSDIHVDLHIMTEPGMSVEDSHTLIHEIEKKLKVEIDRNLQIIVHIEPFHENIEQT